MTVMRWLSLRPNLSGIVLAVIIAGALFGQQIEGDLFPILKNVQVTSVWWRDDDRLQWKLNFCKSRNSRLDAASYTFVYLSAPLRTGVPLAVRNETRAAPVGTSPLPPGCFVIEYSAEVPDDSREGDEIIAEVWYRSFHPFWVVQQDFGKVVVPPR